MIIFGSAFHEFKNRFRAYISDFKDALDYRVVPATVYIFFADVLPAIAFAQDTFDRTQGAFGVNEVLLGSALGGIVFSLFAVQPLVIVSVTGPVCIFLYTVFDIIHTKANFFAFNAWIAIWSLALHLLIVLFNGATYMRKVTTFSANIFGCFNSIIYMEKGVQLLVRQFNLIDEQCIDKGVEAAYFQIVVALLMLMFGASLTLIIGSPTGYLFPRYIRKFVADYSLPLLVVFFTGFTFFPGRISDLSSCVQRLPITKAFQPADNASPFGREHGWFVHFWDIKVGYVFLALPFAILLTALFYFDHNISAIMSQPEKYTMKKPSGLNFDFMLLGITTFVAGILGIPAPNGLIPQAPLHVAALARTNGTIVEQRVSNLLQGLATIGLMTGPLLKVLHLVPQGVLAGLFFMMGFTTFMNNELVHRLFFLLRDRTQPSHSELTQVSNKVLVKFIIVSAIGVAGEVAITQTIAAIGFPGVLFLTIFMARYLPKMFPNDYRVLDQLASPLSSKED